MILYPHSKNRSSSLGTYWHIEIRAHIMSYGIRNSSPNKNTTEDLVGRGGPRSHSTTAKIEKSNFPSHSHVRHISCYKLTLWRSKWWTVSFFVDANTLVQNDTLGEWSILSEAGGSDRHMYCRWMQPQQALHRTTNSCIYGFTTKKNRTDTPQTHGKRRETENKIFWNYSQKKE